MDSLTWVFAPGSNCGKFQVLKYTRAWRGEHDELGISCNKCLEAGDLIGARVTCAEFAEIVPRHSAWSANILEWPRQVFQAGVAALARWRHSGSYRVICAGTSESPNDVADYPSLDWREYNLGQCRDMELLGEALESHRARFRHDGNGALPIVLFGTSRGAATIVNFVASATPEQLEGVVGIILEGCPDSLAMIVREHLFWVPWPLHDLLASCVERCFEAVTSYTSAGPTPLDNIALVPEHIPVLLVTSLGDTVVNPACMQRLRAKLNPRKNVDLIILPTASHPMYACRQPDCSFYRDALYTFYERILQGQNK
jgi:pimeloyl-ACP methyl ester carboxylesterase